jgi:hypothetical protein
MQIFWHFLDMSVVNAFILQARTPTLKKFLTSAAIGLIIASSRPSRDRKVNRVKTFVALKERYN